ncbi:MAG: hypothetical protein CCU27_10350 [Nitrospira sp. UW-LDO-02]|nr:MAG: hypothetical protein CCU27_10350 [Nitrospira sp. UW-LDO-02]SLM44612.1 hypothetical protein NSND_62045 [Nitrospira sp. ND1]HAN91530.1 hypothetical protein [Nitrospira sp.]
MTRFIPRVVNLRGSTYRTREKEPVSAGWGWVDKKHVASPLRIAAAWLDGLFEQLISGLRSPSPQNCSRTFLQWTTSTFCVGF